MLEFNQLEISTITTLVTCNLSLNLSKIFDKIVKCYNLDYYKEMTTQEYKSYTKTLTCGTIQYICYNGIFKGKRRIKKTKKRKRDNFINQITICLYLEGKINLMIFKNCIKICGSRKANDSIQAILFLWNDFIKTEKDCYELFSTHPMFTFDDVMINMRFSLPFNINKIELNKLLQKYTDICESSYEPTSQSYVSLKIYGSNQNKTKIILTLIDDNVTRLNTDLNEKIKKNTSSFMIFEKNVIMSGGNILQMKQHYDFFTKIIYSNEKILNIFYL